MSHRGGCSSLVIWKSNSLFPFPPPQRTRRRLLRGGGGEGGGDTARHPRNPRPRTGGPFRVPSELPTPSASPPPAQHPPQGQHVAPHPGADPVGPTKAGGCHSRPRRPCPRGKAHTLAKGRSSACSTPCDGGLLPSTQTGPRGAGARDDIGAPVELPARAPTANTPHSASPAEGTPSHLAAGFPDPQGTSERGHTPPSPPCPPVGT